MLMEPVDAPARWWPCACLKCVSDLRRLEKNLNFLRCIHVFDLVLKNGSDINEGNWLQLLFYFIVLMGMVASVILTSTVKLARAKLPSKTAGKLLRKQKYLRMQAKISAGTGCLQFLRVTGRNLPAPAGNSHECFYCSRPGGFFQTSVPETYFDRQPHTHHMVTGPTGGGDRTAQTNQFPELLTGRILTPLNPPSHQYQNLSTQVSQDNKLPVVEQTPRNQNADANNSLNRLADAIAGIATQQRHKQPQCSNQYPQIH